MRQVGLVASVDVDAAVCNNYVIVASAFMLVILCVTVTSPASIATAADAATNEGSTVNSADGRQGTPTADEVWSKIRRPPTNIDDLRVIVNRSGLYLHQTSQAGEADHIRNNSSGRRSPTVESETIELLLADSRRRKSRNVTRFIGDDDDTVTAFNYADNDDNDDEVQTDILPPSPISQSAIRRLPHVIIIGAKKGGTRALLEFLRIHPDVRAVGPEVHFFDKFYHRGLDWYRSQMPTTLNGQLTVEKTPSYFVTRGVPERVHRMSADVRLIVVLRDPVDRALSDYAQAVTKRPDLPAFERLAFTGNGRVNASWKTIQLGMYAGHLRRWTSLFGVDRIHFVSGERLVADPAAVVADVEAFLGLRHAVTADHFRFSPSKGFPCLVRDGRVRCLGKTKGRRHPTVDPEALVTLRKFFRPHNDELYRMTGIDFRWQ